MNIIVCIKCVPLIIEQDAINITIKREEAVSEINPADLYAIEEAVRIKERMGATCIGLCMGVSSVSESVIKAIQMGLDDIYLVSDQQLLGSDTLITARVLACAIEHLGGADLIICGKQSTDGDTGQVPQEIASKLGIPCLTNVVEASLYDNHIDCVTLTDHGYACYEVKLPVLISVLKGINQPRIPSIHRVLYAQTYRPKILGARILGFEKSFSGLTSSPTKVKQIRTHSYVKRNNVDISLEYMPRIQQLIDSVDVRGLISDSKEIEYSDVTAQATLGEIWVVCECYDGLLSDVSKQLLSKAKKLADENEMVLCSVVFCDQQLLFNQIASTGAKKIYCPLGKIPDHIFDERVAIALLSACRAYDPNIILFGSTTWGRWIAPFVACQLSTGLTADCFALEIDNNRNLIQTRIAFRGNIIADIVCKKRPQMATIRPYVFNEKQNYKPDYEVIDIAGQYSGANRILAKDCSIIMPDNARLFDSRIIIAGGKGLGSKDNFALLFEFAKIVNGAVAATRFAVDSGWIDYSFQIGQSGSTVKPNIFMAFGISGAPEHTIGMRDSDCIIAINIDPLAPIIKIADYSIIADCVSTLKLLIEEFKNNRRGEK